MITPTACLPKVRHFNSETYVPQPLATLPTHVLPLYAIELTALLAKNPHDLWPKQRIAEGWTFGPTRDDTHRKTPAWCPMKN